MTSALDLPLLELEADDGAEFAVEDPATGETIAMVPRMGAAETERALRAAEEALPGWRSLLAKERAFLTTVDKWDVIQAVDVLVDGPLAAIHWKFELTIAGKRIKMEEIALQRWSGDGEGARIVREQYFAFPPGSTPR